MEHSIGLFEFSSISDGFKMTDLILKSSDVQIHKNELICPGRYVLLIKGNLKSVNNALNTAKAENMKSLLKAEIIPNISDKVFRAINKKVAFENIDAVGVIETKNYVISLVLADLIIKSASVDVLKIMDRFGISGKGIIIYSGTTSEVNCAHNNVIASKYMEDIIRSNKINKPNANYFNI